MKATLPRLLDRKSLASELGVATHTAEAIMRRLPKVTIGRRVFVREDDVERYLKSDDEAELARALIGLVEQFEIAREALDNIAREYGPHTRAGAYASLALTSISLVSSPASESSYHSSSEASR